MREISNLLTRASLSIASDEMIDVLAGGENVRIERIVSMGQSSPPEFWYDQDEDEWVAVIQGEAELEWADGRRARMRTGDWVLIPAHERHRVAWTSTEPPCIWLAVFGKFKPAQ